MAATRYAESRKHIVDGHDIPVRTYYERRRNVRVAVGRDSVLLRIPRHCNRRQRAHYQAWCDAWISRQWRDSPRFRATFTPFRIDTVRAFRTFDRVFQVDVEAHARQTAAVSLRGTLISIALPEHWDSLSRNEVAYKLLHKTLASAYRKDMASRVEAAHGGRFSKPVKSVHLKNMSSKWGSCSHQGKLSFSTRLLFAPEEVLDY
ncbi:MAG: YgjP-like metallopeptidase domain-containing protein, partial [Saprospiraceae bacterium]|nr:YgjP-like metallopeptidase domain-containing protein [Saprospiraceae bacterium]